MSEGWITEEPQSWPAPLGDEPDSADAATAAVAPEPGAAGAASPRRAALARLGLAVARFALFSAVIALALYYGLTLRQWLYPASQSIRAPGDIANAWGHASGILRNARLIQNDALPLTWSSFLAAYFNQYDAVGERRPDGQFRLDYPPARLLIVSAWVLSATEGGLRQPAPPPQDLAAPLLTLNSAMGLAAAVGAFLLARHVLRRAAIRQADFIALVPAVLLWFNATIFLDAHVWPQWDVWIVPFYLFAAYFGVTRRWLLAGACLGAGAMFKGQLLIPMALFVLWPLFQARFRAVLDVSIGVLLAGMLCTSPWMLRTPAAWVFFLATLLVIAGSAVVVRCGWRITFICGTLALTLLLAGLCFDGSFAWWQIGFAYGTRHHMGMTVGPASNLAAALAVRGGWKLSDIAFTLDLPRLGLAGIAVTIRSLLVSVYALTLVLCAIGLARHDAKNDRRMLIAIAAPWVLMFAFMPQMHERYLMWGAATTALCAAVSIGGGLLHLAVTVLASIPIAISLFNHRGNSAWLRRLFAAAYPDAAWAVVLIALVLLYLSLAPSRRRTAVSSAPSRESTPQAESSLALCSASEQ